MQMHTLILLFFCIPVYAFDLDSMLSSEPHGGMFGKTSVNERLLAAAERGDSYEVTQALESPGVNINTTNNSGATPLILASRKGHLQVVRNLVQLGADIQAEDKQGVNALFAAIAENQVPVVAFLADQTDINQQDKQGFTPLMRAVLKNNKALVQALVEKNADLNVKDYRGDTALVMAEDNKLTDIARYLRMAAAGITPTSLAQQIKLITERGKQARAGQQITQQNIREIWKELIPGDRKLTAGEVEQLVAFATDPDQATDQAKNRLWVLANNLIAANPGAIDHAKDKLDPATVDAWYAIIKRKQRR
jgi:ankyrin repeat protein